MVKVRNLTGKSIPAEQHPPRPWLVDGQFRKYNSMLKALWADMKHLLLSDVDNEIDSPERLADEIKEWLGQNGSFYRGCRPTAVVLLELEYKDCLTLGIYYRSLNGVDLNTIAALRFRTDLPVSSWLALNPLSE